MEEVVFELGLFVLFCFGFLQGLSWDLTSR